MHRVIKIICKLHWILFVFFWGFPQFVMPVSVDGRHWDNINWSHVLRKNVVNNVVMSSLRAPWLNGPYKKETHRTAQKHLAHQDATDIQICLIFLCVGFPFYTHVWNTGRIMGTPAAFIGFPLSKSVFIRS